MNILESRSKLKPVDLMSCSDTPIKMIKKQEAPCRNLSPDQVLISLEKTVSSMTGEAAYVLRSQTLDERRKVLEARYKTSMKFISKFPFIGRGNVLRDKIISGAEVNALLDSALQ